MKKILSLLLALAVTVALPAGHWLQAAYAEANGIAISTADDLKAMENNPSGKYYLKNDINVPQNLKLFTDDKNPFKGTLDGNGHKLNGYKYTASQYSEKTALFQHVKGATFKNLKITNVKITLTGGGSAAALVSRSENGTYENITTSGTITVKNRGTEDDDLCNAYGIVEYENGKGTIKNCINNINFNVTHKGQSAPTVAGIIGIMFKGSITNCSNKGKITITHTPNKDWGSSGCTVAGVVDGYFGSTAISNCKNSGNITFTATKTSMGFALQPNVAGVVGEATDSSLISCSNKGKITVINNAKGSIGVSVSGVAGDVTRIGKKVTKCSNSGAVSYTGVNVNGVYTRINVVGVVSTVGKIEQSYNKGKISVNSNVNANVGGISSVCTDMRNCYNAGKISHKGTGFEGGLTATADVLDGYVKSNYSSGKVIGSGKSKLFRGQLIGWYTGCYDVMKRNVFDNYYKTSGKAYGGSDCSWKPWMATSVKVSSLKSGNCPKLTSKYWTYSSKYKRLILKNNKEK